MLATDMFQIIFIGIVVVIGISGMIIVVRSKDEED